MYSNKIITPNIQSALLALAFIVVYAVIFYVKNYILITEEMLEEMYSYYFTTDRIERILANRGGNIFKSISLGGISYLIPFLIYAFGSFVLVRFKKIDVSYSKVVRYYLIVGFLFFIPDVIRIIYFFNKDFQYNYQEFNSFLSLNLGAIITLEEHLNGFIFLINIFDIRYLLFTIALVALFKQKLSLSNKTAALIGIVPFFGFQILFRIVLVFILYIYTS